MPTHQLAATEMHSTNWDYNQPWYHGTPLGLQLSIQEAQSRKIAIWRGYSLTNRHLYRYQMTGRLNTMVRCQDFSIALMK